MTDDLDALRDLARSFCAKEVAPYQRRWRDQHRVDRDVWTRGGAAGLLCLSIPEEFGGGGGTFAHEAVLLEELARVGDTAWGVAVHNVVVAHYLLAYGTEEQRRTWLPAMASGAAVGAIAMTEPGAGSDLQGIATTATRAGADYLIRGAKTFITNATQADLVLVVARTDPDAGSRGISLLIVETDREGFHRGRILDKIGQRGQDASELFFDDVRVPAENLLGGAEGAGFAQLMGQLPKERLTIGVTATAAMETALAHTLRYTKDRKAFGSSIFDFQHTRFTLAEAATEARVARTFVDDCVLRLLRGELDGPTAAMAKWWTTERAMHVIDRCLQLHGGYGYMSEYPISHLWVDQRVQQIYGGTNQIMREIISRSL
ncbi:acyl-CoA dehydrogenase family protein [Nocardia puris]|uniref:Acyl-[acyl-carrier-protein] dehydrogenase MbtN n=1 Tax=Nocardia puris TaxID=208602 RepID=A0A366E3W1_9NOCA|nr:acyl-CoA dehydrogenase family protein [Nocardia puris]MBF6216095.1 acyl-CoA dehydrogenase family protein [Nocardia puris]MBF6368898.1 acyl-CoA dehydrogenase family protein [Nocardia puris]MBF6462479.1 acyl-CoA dehydrogenase family protein [Nocardia puris]RBO97060.1 acyl-CoA dehydrogenase [Nocardia puris]